MCLKIRQSSEKWTFIAVFVCLKIRQLPADIEQVLDSYRLFYLAYSLQSFFAKAPSR